MAGRRAVYLVLLAIAALLHYAYGQYVTHYILLFLILAPVLSSLLTLPAALRARTDLVGGEDVCRGRDSGVRLKVETFGLLPPEAWSVTIGSENLFTATKFNVEKVLVRGEKTAEKQFAADTAEIGSIRYSIKRAFILDYLGLIPIPVRRGRPVSVTVMPDKEQPVPEPELVARSAMALKPKPQGFSEEHELRPYRDGDPLNLIHWKLTAKYDETIIREPQEEVRKNIVLVMDLPVLYREHRSVLEQLAYINDQLLEKQIPYTLHYGKKQAYITSENDYNEFIKGMLSERMQREKTDAVYSNTEDALVYRIRPGRRTVL